MESNREYVSSVVSFAQKDGVRWLFCEEIGTKASGERFKKSRQEREATAGRKRKALFDIAGLF